MPADDQFEFNDSVRIRERSFQVAVGFLDNCGLGIEPRREFARRRQRIEARRQRLDLRLDEIGDVFGRVGIGGEDQRDRLADIAHVALRQDRLAIGLQPRHRGQAKTDRRNVGDIGRGPDRGRTGMGKCLVQAKPGEPAERDGRAHHPHPEHVRRHDIGGECSGTQSAAAGLQAA
jgi:hypothetical protein